MYRHSPCISNQQTTSFIFYLCILFFLQFLSVFQFRSTRFFKRMHRATNASAERRPRSTMQFSSWIKKQQQKCWTYSVDVDVPADTWFKTQYRRRCRQHRPSPMGIMHSTYATRHIIILWYIFRISVWCFVFRKYNFVLQKQHVYRVSCLSFIAHIAEWKHLRQVISFIGHHLALTKIENEAAIEVNEMFIESLSYGNMKIY